MTHNEAREIFNKEFEAGKFSAYYEQQKNRIMESEKGLVYKARRLAELQSKIERVKDFTLPKNIRISIDWKRSSSFCTVYIDGFKFVGTAYGWGYDRESESFAQAINSSDWALFFCSLEIKEYGIKDSYFDGGVGMGCFERFFKKLGYSYSYMHGAAFNGWEFNLRKEA